MHMHNASHSLSRCFTLNPLLLILLQYMQEATIISKPNNLCILRGNMSTDAKRYQREDCKLLDISYKY